MEKSLKTNSNNLNTLHISIHNEQTHENSKILFRKDVQARLEQEKAGKSFKKKEVNWFLMKGNFSLTINYLFLKMRPEHISLKLNIQFGIIMEVGKFLTH